MTGTVKDAAVTAYVTSAVGFAWISDFNDVLIAVSLLLGAILALLRIVRVLKFWNTKE